VSKLQVLISAYACEPNSGSEPQVGWNVAREMAKGHEVWVLTRENNRSVIEAELRHNPLPGLHFAYYDLPRWARWWKRGRRGIQLYYYLWQLGAYFMGRKLHREISFDLVHHVTFVKYWAPSFAAFMPTPFIWGPVGGGESAPVAYRHDFSFRGKVYEIVRDLARELAERDPLVRLTARRSTIICATTKDTAERVRKIGARYVTVFSQLGLSHEEITELGQYPIPDGSTIRFISMGRLLHWKGFHIGLRAFARASLPNAEYWIVGDGPERERLQALVKALEITGRVKFWGSLSRDQSLSKLGECNVLVHPSLHDSGGLVCLEAMAAGRPVLCLDLGGPAVQVTEETGYKITIDDPEQAVNDLAEAMLALAQDSDRAVRMGEAGRRRAIEHFSWAEKGNQISDLYRSATDGSKSLMVKRV
jgi:glycosyltransferase involved in cell wall biosynthesis